MTKWRTLGLTLNGGYWQNAWRMETVYLETPIISYLASEFVRAGILPRNAASDAVHLAVAAIAHGNSAARGALSMGAMPVLGSVEKIVPVNFYIPGCPPRPEAIIYGVAVALGLVDKKTAPVQFKQTELPIPRYHPGDLRGRDELVVYEKVEKV